MRNLAYAGAPQARLAGMVELRVTLAQRRLQLVGAAWLATVAMRMRDRRRTRQRGVYKEI
jgi:hypothetical protein